MLPGLPRIPAGGVGHWDEGMLVIPPGTVLAFAVAAVIAVAIPGPTVLLALANGTRLGMRRTWFGIAGAVASDVVLITAVALGLGALLLASEIAFEIVRWVGVAYLVYLAVRLLFSRGRPAHEPAATPASRGRVFLASFLVAVTNPKGYLFLGALLPQFLDPAQPQVPQYLVLGGLFCLIDLAILVLYAVLGARAFRRLGSRGILTVDRVSGVALLVLAVWLAVAHRAGG